jgi:uncharacterized protein
MIGIMSDSHDNIDAIRKAINEFNSQELDLVIHAGDLISPFTAIEFEKLDPELIAIYGNNDGEREGLRNAYKEISSLDDFKEISIGGRRISIIHGTNQSIVEALAKSGNYDVVVRGHTHRMEIFEGETMIINPGETCGYLSGQKTVVLLDTDDLSFEIIHL